MAKIFPSESKALMTSWTWPAVRYFLTPSHHSDGSNNISGTQLRDNLLRWLSPPDPSTNHNIASKAHHNGTAEWFFRNNLFSRWKSTGSFLWIHGKRALYLPFILRQPLIVSCFHSGVREKCPLVRLSLDSFRPREIDIIISVPRSYKISYPCAMLGGPLWPTFISTSGTSINKNFTTCFHLFSSNFLLGPILVVMYFPSSILRVVVGRRYLVIGKWLNASKICSVSRRNHLFTSFWMHLTSVPSRQPFHHLREKRFWSLWMKSSPFTSQTSTYASRVGRSMTFGLSSNV